MLSMFNTNLVIAVIVNTAISVIIGTFWYSMKGFGNIWIEKYYGSRKNFDTSVRKYSQEVIMLTTIVCPLMYNFLLAFIVNNVYSPYSIKDVIIMALILMAIHVLLELPHVGFENRSYEALMVHVAYHFVTTVVQLMVFNYFFKIPAAFIKV